jgi:hypothetical protein
LILTPESIGSVPLLNSEAAADSMPQVADSGPRMNEPSPILWFNSEFLVVAAADSGPRMNQSSPILWFNPKSVVVAAADSGPRMNQPRPILGTIQNPW